jgi:CDP-diacylglycerol--inositol 3-phosphatidyltransferase
MVTDRFGTACLCVVLAGLLPAFAWAFQLLIALDLSSHFYHMYASLIGGSTSHKQVDRSKNIIIRLYYSSRFVLTVLCLFNEYFYVALFMRVADTNSPLAPLWTLVLYVSTPFWAVKQSINVVQLASAAHALVLMDEKDLDGDILRRRTQSFGSIVQAAKPLLANAATVETPAVAQEASSPTTASFSHLKKAD